MRRLSPLISILALALAACSSGAAPGWTYAPAPSATAAASGGASGGPTGSGGASGAPSAGASSGSSAAPSGEASGAPSPGASAGGSPIASSGATLTVTAPVGAATAGFEPTTLSASAGTAFNLLFDNQDNQAPHNVVIQDPSGANVPVSGDAAFFPGPGQRQLGVPALTAGAYTYLCQGHPTTMKGTLTVQ